MAFYSGQKIVCIKDNWFPMANIPAEAELPKAKRVYTFRGYHPCKIGYLFLCEISVPSGDAFEEVGFITTHSRPLVEKKTDISIFTKILNPERVSA